MGMRHFCLVAGIGLICGLPGVCQDQLWGQGASPAPGVEFWNQYLGFGWSNGASGQAVPAHWGGNQNQTVRWYSGYNQQAVRGTWNGSTGSEGYANIPVAAFYPGVEDEFLFFPFRYARPNPCNNGFNGGTFLPVENGSTLPDTQAGVLNLFTFVSNGTGDSLRVNQSTGSVMAELAFNNGQLTGNSTISLYNGQVTGSGPVVVTLDAFGFPINSTLTENLNTPTGTPTDIYRSTLNPNSAFAAGQCGTGPVFGDPVSVGNGEYTYTFQPTIQLGGPLPLGLQLYYSTFLNLNGDNSSLGYNWMHNFDQRLTVNGNLANLLLFGGGTVSFQQSNGAWKTQFPARRAFQFASSAANFRFLDPTSNLLYSFDPKGVLTRIEDRNGNALTITPSPNGPTLIADGLGRSLAFTYANGRLTKVQDQTGRSMTFSYTGNDMTGVTDALGNTTNFSYAGGNRMTKATRPAGNTPYTQSYDAFGRVTQQTDSFNGKTSFSYNNGGVSGAQSWIDPLGRTLSFTMPNLMDLTAFKDAAGNGGSVGYDAVRRPNSYTDRLGNKSSVTYDAASGYPASVTDALGNTTSYTYLAQPQNGFTYFVVSKVTYADNTSASFTYDSSGNLLTTTDRAGKVTKFTYNSRGQILTATNAAGGVTTYTYNTDATLATVKSPAGDTTTLTYDTLKRPVKAQFADNTSASVTYDALDQILSIADQNGKVTKFAYDRNTNLQQVTDPLNQTAKLAYDSDDLLTSATDRLGGSTRVQYDPLGFATSVTNAGGEKTTFAYDSLQSLKSVTDPGGKTSSFTYDTEGRLTSATDADGNTVKYTRDKDGRVTRSTSALNENADLAYDTLGRVTAVTDGLGRKTTMAYEKRGLPAAISAPGGITTAIGWGDLPVPLSVTDPNGNTWASTFDNLGRLTAMTDPLGQAVTYTYDSRNRVASISSAADSVQITYDAAGNAVGAQYSDGTSVSYTYDDKNRLTGGTGLALAYDANDRVVSSNGLTLTRDAVGRITSVNYGPNLTVNYAYDSRGQLRQVGDSAGGGASFTYDNAQLLSSISRTNGVTTQYGYDKDRRLISIAEAGSGGTIAAINLTRDAAGRVTSANRNIPQEAAPAPGTLALGFDAANQISGMTYDARGRLTSGLGGAAYTWTPGSRLASYVRADGSATFTYDALGQRISRTGPDGTVSNYVLNYATALPTAATVQVAGADVSYYVYTPDGSLLYSVSAADNSHRYYSFDDTGSTTFLTDDTGNVTDSYGITAYGDTVTAGPSNATDNPFTWQGQFGAMREAGTSLFYLRYRYYDAASSAFLSRDPLASFAPRQINAYAYAVGDPVNFNDPAGLKVGTIPRFIDTSSAKNAVSISICRSILLYPFITNQSGFDTGLAVADTSTDPFMTNAQNGTCTLNWYGMAAPASAVTTPSTVLPGQPVYTTLPGLVVPFFQGSITPICNPQYNRGFPILSDADSRSLAERYLALTLPNSEGCR